MPTATISTQTKIDILRETDMPEDCQYFEQTPEGELAEDVLSHASAIWLAISDYNPKELREAIAEMRSLLEVLEGEFLSPPN
jgi:hypothetical protein